MITLKERNEYTLEASKEIKKVFEKEYALPEETIKIMSNETNYFVVLFDIEQFNCDMMKAIEKVTKEVYWDVFEDEYFEIEREHLGDLEEVQFV